MDEIDIAILTVVGSKGIGIAIFNSDIFFTLDTHYRIPPAVSRPKLRQLLLDRYVEVNNDRYRLTQRGLNFLNAIDDATNTATTIDTTTQTSINSNPVRWVSVFKYVFTWLMKHIVWVILLSIIGGILTDYIIRKYHPFQ